MLFRDCRCGLLRTTADGSSVAAFPKGGTAVTGFVLYRGLHVLVSGGLCQSCSICILVKRKKNQTKGLASCVFEREPSSGIEICRRIWNTLRDFKGT